MPPQGTENLKRACDRCAAEREDAKDEAREQGGAEEEDTVAAQELEVAALA